MSDPQVQDSSLISVTMYGKQGGPKQSNQR